LRAKGSTYQFRDDGTVTNLYSLELINKTTRDIDYELVSEDKDVEIQIVNPISHLPREGNAKLSLFLIAKKSNIKEYKTDIKLNVVADGEVIETMKTTFIAPPAK